MAQDSHFEQVQAAAQRLAGHAHRTPVMTSRTLDQQVGAQIFMKCENLQRGGAFKFRGAYNAIAQLSEAQKQRGVITHSSGNHAQAVALVCQTLGIAATIVMPNNAPRIKRHATEHTYGANVVEYDPAQTNREALSAQIAAETGAVLVPPYDHEHIVHGQGTAAYELLQAVPDLDGLLVPCGGGGLLSGSAIAAKGMSSTCRVVGIEPVLADDATRSFRTGVLHTISNPPTIADGTRTPCLGHVTFPLVQRYVDDMQTVSEEAIKAAVRFLYERVKLVVEPSGALGIAALLEKAIVPQSGQKIGVILSGGNMDAALLTQIFTAPAHQ